MGDHPHGFRSAAVNADARFRAARGPCGGHCLHRGSRRRSHRGVGEEGAGVPYPQSLQVGQSHGLAQHMIRPVCLECAHVILHHIARDANDHAVTPHLSQYAGGSGTIRARHLIVHEDRIKGSPTVQRSGVFVNCLLPVLCLHAIVFLAGEQANQHLSIGKNIINDENTERGHLNLSPALYAEQLLGSGSCSTGMTHTTLFNGADITKGCVLLLLLLFLPLFLPRRQHQMRGRGAPLTADFRTCW
mmetsp:Transcript_22954/g.38278  ORF Transcript_22954/g.38278 Transcript_22954/m.38278 type:complete len:245 (-) Transcript_22954:2539-3273(-)